MAPPHLPSTLVTISAPLSIIGSFSIIYVISRSTDKLNTTLHRLLVGLCIGDLLTSIALAFTKVIINFEGFPVVNNQAACGAQGFLIVLGGIVSPFYNCGLCVYYLCVIKWNYSNAKMTKNVEPFLHAIPWLWGLFSAIFVVATNNVNLGFGYCSINNAPAPLECTADASADCSGGINAVKLRWALQGGPLFAIFFAICIQMAVIYLHVWRLERKMRNAGYRSTNAARAGRRRRMPEANMIVGRQTAAQANSGRGVLRQSVSNSRKTLNQALAYVGAYFITYFLVFLSGFMFLATGKYNDIIVLIALFLYPLQGFLNFIVFIFSKVTSQLRGNDNMNIVQALWAAIQCKPIPPRRRNQAVVGSSSGGNNSRVRNISGLRGTENWHPNATGNVVNQDPALSSTSSSISLSNSTHLPTSSRIPDSQKVSIGEEATSGEKHPDMFTESFLSETDATLTTMPKLLSKGSISPHGSVVISPKLLELISEKNVSVHMGDAHEKLDSSECSQGRSATFGANGDSEINDFGQGGSITFGEKSCCSANDDDDDVEVGSLLKEEDRT